MGQSKSEHAVPRRALIFQFLVPPARAFEALQRAHPTDRDPESFKLPTCRLSGVLGVGSRPRLHAVKKDHRASIQIQ